MEAISKNQIRRIYASSKTLGLVENGNKTDSLHLLLSSLTGKSSVLELSFDEASKLISELQFRLRFRDEKETIQAEKPGGVSSGQQRKIIALMCELRKLDLKPNHISIERRVAGIIRKDLKISAISANPYAWLNYSDGVKLIEIIKGLLETAQRAAIARGDSG